MVIHLRSCWRAALVLAATSFASPAVLAQDEAERLRRKAEEMQKEAQRMAERAEKARVKAEEEARKKEERKAKREAEKAAAAEKKRQKAEERKAKREAEERKPEEAVAAPPPPPPPPVEAAPAPPQAAPAVVARAPEGPPPRVESVAGARWSSNLGFLHTGLTAVSVLGPDGTSHVATTTAPPPVPKDAVTGEPIKEVYGIEGRGFGFFALQLGFVTFQPAAPSSAAPSPVVGARTAQELKGNDFQIGVKLVFGSSGVGGWIAPGMRVITAKDDSDNSLFVFSPMGFDGGIDFFLVEDHLSIGPRAGGFVAPLFIYSPSDSSSSSSSSSSSDPAIWLGVEYGGTARAKFASLYAEASFYFRKGIDTTGQYAAVEAGYVIRPAVIFVNYETRLEAEGEPDFSDSIGQGVANSMPEKDRIGLGLGIAFN